MTTVHIVSSFFPPTPGGLQLWTQSLATALAADGFQAIVYVCEHPAVAGLHRDAPFEIVDVAPLAEVWLEPLRGSDIPPQRFDRERSRILFACLKAEVAR